MQSHQRLKLLAWTTLLALSAATVSAQNVADAARKAVEKSTLNQPGTKPFHLKAGFAPTSERDKDSNRAGQVEFWWQSPHKWRREVRCAEFHQVTIEDGDRHW